MDNSNDALMIRRDAREAEFRSASTCISSLLDMALDSTIVGSLCIFFLASDDYLKREVPFSLQWRNRLRSWEMYGKGLYMKGDLYLPSVADGRLNRVFCDTLCLDLILPLLRRAFCDSLVSNSAFNLSSFCLLAIRM